jgi:hypothetical protein
MVIAEFDGVLGSDETDTVILVETKSKVLVSATTAGLRSPRYDYQPKIRADILRPAIHQIQAHWCFGRQWQAENGSIDCDSVYKYVLN